MTKKAVLNRLKAIFRTIFDPILLHLQVLLYQFDPVLDAPKGISSATNLSLYRAHRAKIDEETKHRFFLFPIGVLIFNLFDTMYVLSTHDFQYDNRGMPELFYHQVFPKQFWPQSDLIMVSIITCSLLVYYNLWQTKWLDDRYCMYSLNASRLGTHKLIVNGKGLSLYEVLDMI